MSSFKPVDRKRLKEKGFPAPISLSRELINSLSEKQRKILFDLRDLGEKEQKISEMIDKKKPNPSGIIGFPDGSVTLCEDRDDFMVITMNERQQLAVAREQIADKLSEALDCGMGSLGVIQRHCANYGVRP